MPSSIAHAANAGLVGWRLNTPREAAKSLTSCRPFRPLLANPLDICSLKVDSIVL